MSPPEDLVTKSGAFFERSQKSSAGGVNSGIRKLEAPVPLFFSHGKGSRLFDVDGNEYIDFQIGQAAILYGHAQEGMADAIASHARLGSDWSAQSEMECEVAERLQQMIPSAERVRFNSSATEVVTAAFRIARAHTGRKLIFKREPRRPRARELRNRAKSNFSPIYQLSETPPSSSQ